MGETVSTLGSGSKAPLMCVEVVLRSHGAMAEWKQVRELIEACLDYTVIVTPEAAAKRGFEYYFRRLEQDDLGLPYGMVMKCVRLATLQGHKALIDSLIKQQKNANFEMVAIHTAVETAAQRGTLELVQLLYEQHPYAFTEHTMNVAVKYGHMHIAEWLHESLDMEIPDVHVAQATDEGDTDMYKWIFLRISKELAQKQRNTIAESGDLKKIKWLHYNWPNACFTHAINKAAKHGHLWVVKWLDYNRTEEFTAKAMDGAASNGHLDMVKWLHTNRTEGCTTDAMDGAARNGHLSLVRWMHENRHEGCTPMAMVGAAEHPYRGVMQFLLSTFGTEYLEQAIDAATVQKKHTVVDRLIKMRLRTRVVDRPHKRARMSS